MRKTMILLVTLVVAAPVFAGVDLNVGDVIRFYDREGGNRGGEYGVALTADEVDVDRFRTFCVEQNEFMDFGGARFNVVGITGAAVNGGNGGGNPDPLDARTAYLYSSFRAGTLSNYDYAADSPARIADANALQAAIWAIEQEATTANAQALLWIAEANTAVTSTTGAWYRRGLGNVRVANLTWVGNNTRAQDVLVLVPAPGAALLALIGLPIVGWVKRRFA